MQLARNNYLTLCEVEVYGWSKYSIQSLFSSSDFNKMIHCAGSDICSLEMHPSPRCDLKRPCIALKNPWNSFYVNLHKTGIAWVSCFTFIFLSTRNDLQWMVLAQPIQSSKLSNEYMVLIFQASFSLSSTFFSLHLVSFMVIRHSWLDAALVLHCRFCSLPDENILNCEGAFREIL